MAALLVLFAAGETDNVPTPITVAPQGCCLPPAAARNVTVMTKQPGAVLKQVRPVAAAPSLVTGGRLTPAGHTAPVAVRHLPPVVAAPPAVPPAPAVASDALPARGLRILPAAELPEQVAGADGAPAEGGSAGSAAQVAGAVMGTLASRSRPSQLFAGAGEGSLLGGLADAYWGLGEQTAMQLIVQGRAPDMRQVAKGAAQIAAAAANQNMARLVDDATQYGQDNAIPFLRNLELGAQWYPGQRPSLEARTIDTLFQSVARDHTLFLQGSVSTDFSDTTANLGLGYRYSLPDSRWMLGVNAFYDREFPIGHERMSIGLEASTSDFTLFGNRYFALSGWTEKNADYDERPLSGWDAGVTGNLPWLEDLSLSAAAFHWEREAHADKTGLRLTADYDVSEALQLGATVLADDAGGVQAGLHLSYQFGADQFRGDIGSGPAADRRLGFVNRDNIIRTEKREVPRNYAVSFLDSAVTADNQSALSVSIAGAPPDARYSFAITSSNGGTAVTGTGRLGGDQQVISGIDVSGLPDGTLTLTLRLVSRQGASGAPVTAQIVKSTAGLGVTTAAAVGSPTNASPIGFTIRFSQVVTAFDVAHLNVTNGTAADLRSDDGLIWSVSVTPAGQGTVTLEVPAGAATSGGITNAEASQASVVYDSAAPAGYGVSFLTGPFAAAGFEIANGEVGSEFRFTISSSGGGSPVTGTGVMTATQQQVTGLDLTGLPDGTLTLSVTLADTLGNAGSPATATLQKDTEGLVILAVIPPDPGDYDDL